MSKLKDKMFLIIAPTFIYIMWNGIINIHLKNLVKWPFQPTLGYVTYLGANIGMFRLIGVLKAPWGLARLIRVLRGLLKGCFD
jgi:hypothetical protein